jgi:hypothetical protein
VKPAKPRHGCDMHLHRHVSVWRIETEIEEASRDAGTVCISSELARSTLKLGQKQPSKSKLDRPSPYHDPASMHVTGAD